MPLEGFDDIDPPKNLGGRPRSVIDLAVVERGASIGCTREELAALCGVPRSTFFKHLAEDPDLQEAIDRGAELGRATLRRAQWKGAVVDGNPTMMIWLGKQLLGQRDAHALQTLDKDGNPTDPVVPILTVTLARE